MFHWSPGNTARCHQSWRKPQVSPAVKKVVYLIIAKVSPTTQVFVFRISFINYMDVVCLKVPSLKLIAAQEPLKMGRNPKGKDRLPIINCQGRAVSFTDGSLSMSILLFTRYSKMYIQTVVLWDSGTINSMVLFRTLDGYHPVSVRTDN